MGCFWGAQSGFLVNLPQIESVDNMGNMLMYYGGPVFLAIVPFAA